MLEQFVSAVIDALLAIPPVRFVMGLVESRWRPLWAALWIAVIAYLVSRTMNQLALRRARLRILSEPPDGLPVASRSASIGTADTSSEHGGGLPTRGGAEATGTQGVPGPGAGSTTPAVPLPVVGAALVIGAIVVAGVAVATRTAPNDSSPAVMPVSSDTAVARPERPIDVRYRSGRMEGDHCIGTFEVTHGNGTRARLVAFVMDSSGAVIGRDSARVESAVSGIFVDFRFRYVECDEIDDWQIQATTPRASP